MYVRKIMFAQKNKQPYSLDSHGDAMGMYHCALENMTDFSFAQN